MLETWGNVKKCWKIVERLIKIVRNTGRAHKNCGSVYKIEVELIKIAKNAGEVHKNCEGAQADRSTPL